jgi:acyl carrier protein
MTLKWTSETMLSELMKVFEQHAQGGVDISEKSHLVADLGIDSLGQMELVADIEDAFRLNIPDDALREIETIGDVARAIETRLKAEGRLEG